MPDWPVLPIVGACLCWAIDNNLTRKVSAGDAVQITGVKGGDGRFSQPRLSARRTAVDWAHQVKEVVEAPRYANAERITLVSDQLNTHWLASLYETFAPEEAMRLARKLELVHTPKHGSWLNMAEPELSVLSRQCLRQRIGDIEPTRGLAQQWASARNQQKTGIDWQFRTGQARIKLKYLYPKIEE